MKLHIKLWYWNKLLKELKYSFLTTLFLQPNSFHVFFYLMKNNKVTSFLKVCHLSKNKGKNWIIREKDIKNVSWSLLSVWFCSLYFDAVRSMLCALRSLILFICDGNINHCGKGTEICIGTKEENILKKINTQCNEIHTNYFPN